MTNQLFSEMEKSKSLENVPNTYGEKDEKGHLSIIFWTSYTIYVSILLKASVIYPQVAKRQLFFLRQRPGSERILDIRRCMNSGTEIRKHLAAIYLTIPPSYWAIALCSVSYITIPNLRGRVELCKI